MFYVTTPGADRLSLELLRDNAPQVVSVVRFRRCGRQLSEPLRVDKAPPVRDLLGAGDLEALPRFDGMDEEAGLEQCGGGPGIEPGDSPPSQTAEPSAAR